MKININEILTEAQIAVSVEAVKKRQLTETDSDLIHCERMEIIVNNLLVSALAISPTMILADPLVVADILRTMAVISFEAGRRYGLQEKADAIVEELFREKPMTKSPYKVVYILPQDLIDLGNVLLAAHESSQNPRTKMSRELSEYGITEGRLAELADKIRKEVDKL